jgi:hypothetical protein
VHDATRVSIHCTLLRLIEIREREHGSEETAIKVLVTLQTMYESLSLLRECRAILLDHAKGLVDIFLDMRIWITRSDDTLRSGSQRLRPIPKPRCEFLPYRGHVHRPCGQIPTDNDCKSCPIVNFVRGWYAEEKTEPTVDSRNWRMIVNSSLI